ncbi:LCCL domain containing protein [Babesia gibsoni]|uniref:LCCL domain containing protein n=1 Tax=Babesia gibsoni TaxID=33632 RepID=A0AAD8PFW9_BABGI|nr:LCCL domain containing protein [Babesia gibsoni]
MKSQASLRRLLSTIIAFLVHFVDARNANEFYTFKDATATSTYITHTNDDKKFGAARAYQIGASYWCSAGHHASTDFVSWTGELWDTAKVSQVEVMWEYAPKEVEISTSITDDSFNVVMPFKETFDKKPSYKEVFKLEQPVEARFIRLTLRGCINDYFGIREIHIVGAGNPLFAIKSGISSPSGEMCLQLEEGRRDDNTRVVLDLCSHAIAAADGRDLWRHDSRQRIVSAVTSPPKCLTSVSPSKVGALVITDCKDDASDVCRWEFMGNSQISLKNAEELCMTQANIYSDKAGMGNLLDIMKSDITITASSASDKHNVELVMDGKTETYWASELFLDSNIHSTNITINFNQPIHASRVKIDWEYQPMSYTIEGSTDNIVFTELARNMSNSDHVTMDSLKDKEFKQLRLVMLRPHHSMGKIPDGFIYGIREMEVLTSNLQTVVGDCRAAANTSDARDKYFVSYVSTFQPKLANEIKNMENEIHGLTGEIMDEMESLTESVDNSDSCMQEKKEYGKTLDHMHNREAGVWKQIQKSSLCDKSNQTEEMYSTLGETITNAAEDCYLIKQKSKSATSGFYWIQPKCSKHPIRAYCDMNSQTSMFVWDGKGDSASPQALHKMISPLAIKYQCASYGLEPLIVKSKHQLSGLKEALYLMGFERKVNHYVPLAYKFGSSHKFRDLMNVFSFITDSQLPVYNRDDAMIDSMKLPHFLDHNAAGLSLATGEIEKFDMESANIGAIVCSTNVTEDNMIPIDLTCDDRINKSEHLIANTNTNIIVRCSEDCSEKDIPVYGTDGLYNERSSICRAAIHAGVIASKGTFTVSIESGLPYYSGSTMNGVQSFAYNKGWQGSKDILDPQMPEGEKEIDHTGPPSKYSVRILPLERMCPIVETHGSFLQIPQDASHNTNNKTEAKNKDPDKETSTCTEECKNGEVMDIANLDPTTRNEALKVIRDMNALYGFDPKTVVSTVENIAAVVSRAKKYIKPLEAINHHQEKTLTTLFDRVELASQKTAHLKESRESHKTNYQRLLHEQKAKGIESNDPLQMDYTKMAFSKSFKIYDTNMTSGGPSRWGYSDAPFEGHATYMVQSSSIDSSLIGEGSYAMVTNHRYFNFDLKADVLAKNEGLIGIAFRVQDQFNFYLFVMNSRHSNKQLLKMQDGVVHVIATNKDEGYEKNKWMNVHISVDHNTIDIRCDGVNILRVLDKGFLHGGVGLYSCGTDGDFYFDHFTVIPKQEPIKSEEEAMSRLKVLQCCTYDEKFSGDVSDAFTVINPHHNHTTSWRYKDIIGGRHKAIHQHRPSYDKLDVGSLAILKNDRLCSSGYLRFRFLPQCEGGTIGAVIRYADNENMILVELNSNELRIRSITAGVPKVLATVPASFTLSKWNVMEVEMKNKIISVKVNNNVEHGSFLTSLFKSSDFECRAEVENINNFGLKLGLKTSACDSCYFDTLQVSPDPMKNAIPATNFVEEFSSVNVWKPCVDNTHVLSRVSLCKQMSRNKGNTNECTESFCSSCCKYHTVLLGDGHRQICSSACQKNNHIANEYLERFLSYVNSCVSLKGAAFDHCNGDQSCLKDACRLCCGSGHQETSPLDKHLIAMEVSSCIKQCNNVF